MKGMFIRPSYDYVYSNFKFGSTKEVFPPLGYLYLASYLESNGHKVDIIDGEIDQLDDYQIINQVLKSNPDFVGIGCTTPEFNHNSDLLRKIKGISPHTIIITGGPHPSALPEVTLRENPHIDYLIRYEGEQTFLELLNTLEKNNDVKKIKGLTYRKNQTIMSNPDREVIPDIDALPFPARYLIDNKKYLHPITTKKGLVPSTSMQTSRGCPHQCVFCYRSKELSKVRFRSPSNVVDEIEEVVNRYGIRFIEFCDDTMTFPRKRILNICDEIIERKIDIQWFCLARTDTLDRELLVKMKKAGMIQLSIGVESGNQKILDSNLKKTKLEQYRSAYKLLTSLGIETRGSFILGLPYETPETLRDTINFAKSLDLTRAFFNIATPYPGSVLYDKAINEDGIRIVTKDWKEYQRWGNAVIELQDVSRLDLIKLQKRAMLEFYLRPHIIWHHLKQIVMKGHDISYYQPQVIKGLLSMFNTQNPKK